MSTSDQDSVPPRPGGVGGGALALGVVAILLFLSRVTFLAIPAIGCAIWAILLGARSLRTGDGGGQAVSAVFGIVLGTVALVFGLLVFTAPLIFGI